MQQGVETPWTSAPYMTEAVPAALVMSFVFAPMPHSCHILPTELRNLLSLPLMTLVALLFPSPAAVPRSLAWLVWLSTCVLDFLATLAASARVDATTVDLAVETLSASWS